MRLPRIFYEGALYHVFSRGNNRSVLFGDDMDREFFLDLLISKKKEFGIRCFSYVLMTDHFHLLLETPGANLDKVMQSLCQIYTRYFNRRHERSGHLFESRYKCRLVQKERYLMALIRYIHLNPVKAGLAGSAAEYRWSSHGEFMTPRQGSLTDWQEILPHFSQNLDRACHLYGEFVLKSIPEKEWKTLDRKWNGIIGDAIFRASMRGGRLRGGIPLSSGESGPADVLVAIDEKNQYDTQ